MAPGHWAFRVENPPLVESLGWGLVDYRHRRHYLNCCGSPLGEGNQNLRYPDRPHLEGGSFYTLQQFNEIF